MSQQGRQTERYVGWDLIGTGGTANVYRVEDTELRLPVAIKLLNETYRHNEKLLQGLRHEVLISRRLRHEYICPIHDIYEGGRGFGIVMDLLSGTTLRDWMNNNSDALLDTIPRRLVLLRKVAEALSVAHAQIVHRDLKPSNIFLHTGDIEQPLILDFGISVMTTGAEEGFGGGTLKYMAPEQAEPPYQVDSRADLFAFGVMAYELLSGGRLPASSLVDFLKTHVLPRVPISEIVPPSQFCTAIPPSLDRIVLQLLSYNPGDRPGTAAEVLDVLRGVDFGGAHRPISSNPRGERVTVPAGEYFIGSGPAANNVEEQPMRRVVLSAYEIDMAPVSVADYRAFLDHTGYQRPAHLDLTGASDNLPVNGITWHDAMAYANNVGGTLPSEAQWEVAAKAGERLLDFPWGDEPPSATVANINHTVGARTAIKSYPAGKNAWGLWDMCGNVWEWCRDDWDPALYRSMKPGTINPVYDIGSNDKSIRGGSFESFEEMGRCAFRQFAPVEERRHDIGFRVTYEA